MKRTTEFEQEFRKGRNDAYGDLMGHLQWASGIAVRTLIAVLRGRTTPMKDRLRACDILLPHVGAARVEELDALVEHVEELSEAGRRRKK